jgi:copper oxidase (laccase) domain-containing protein
VAGLHVGWRGNRAEFPGLAVAALCDRYGARPDELVAVRGPSLGPGSSEFVNFDLEWGEAYRAYHDPAARTVDLWRLTRDQLVRAGLKAGCIFSLDLDTCVLPEFFSYRRDRITGRQASLVWISRPGSGTHG